MLLSYLTDKTMLSSVVCRDWSELVDVAGAPLVEQGAIDPQYLASIKQTVKRYGAYMVLVEGVALLHGRPEHAVKRIALSLVTLSQPVDLLGKPVKAAFMLAALDNDSHVDLLRELAQALSDPELLTLLRQDAPRLAITNRMAILEKDHESD